MRHLCIKALGLWRVAALGLPPRIPDRDPDFWRGLQPAPEDAQFPRGGYLGSSKPLLLLVLLGTWVLLGSGPSASTGLCGLSDCDPDSEAGLLAACSKEAHPAQL